MAPFSIGFCFLLNVLSLNANSRSIRSYSIVHCSPTCTLVLELVYVTSDKSTRNHASSAHHRHLSCVRFILKISLVLIFWGLCRFVKELLLMSQNNYPYLTDHTFFVNTPWMLSVVWAVLKTVLSKHTLSKSHILTTAYHDTLMEYIDVSNLPLEFRPEHSGTTAGTGTERGGSSTNHSSALRSGGSTDGTPSETVDEDSSPASSTASSRAGIAIPSNSSSSSNSGRSHGGGSTSSSSVALSPGASEDGAAGQVRSPGKKSSSLFGLSRSREASREVKVREKHMYLNCPPRSCWPLFLRMY